MKPLILLLTVFAIGIMIRTLRNQNKPSSSILGRIAMSSMLVFTGVAHFFFADGMMQMIPEFVPYRLEMIYLTGVLEIAGAIGLLINSTSRLTGWCLIIFLIMVLPANIYAALHHIDPVTGSLDGNGPDYLFFRIPLQLFFIAWIYLSAVKPFSNLKTT